MNHPEPDTARAEALIAKLNALSPLSGVPLWDCQEAKDIDRMDEILQELWATGAQERATAALFGVFERFPVGYDAYGVFWSILHGLEKLPDYETELIASVRRVPVEFNLLMINRVLNVDQTHIGETDLMELLREVAARTDIDEEARKNTLGHIEYQESKKAQ